MTSPDDSARDDSWQRPEPDLPLDEEAAWLSIVANYGDRPEMGPDAGPDPVVPPPAPTKPRTPAPPDQLAEQPARRHEDEHFVPPEPPPVPRATPARRIAWLGLFVPPLLMLAAVVFRWTYPSWLTFALVAAFVGGFVFLIATMPRDGGDGWDDGAVV